MVYRNALREAPCVSCADRSGLYYRPSVAWERSRKVKVKRGPSWMRESA